MKENVLEVLMYLFENYMDEDPEFNADQETLAARLSEAGFRRGEITKAFAWLEDLSSMCEQNGSEDSEATTPALRHYSPQECEKLDTAARGFLLFLEQHGILDAVTRETVVDRVMALDSEEFDLEQLKWVVMMVLYNQPGRDHACAWVEELVYDQVRGDVH
jgi:Smg protein